MNYQQARDYLDNLQFFKIKLGLEAIDSLLAEMGSPHQDLPAVHIAGTNGKGSVGVTLLSVLTQAGYRVGFYSSPHLSSVRERFRIGDHYISKKSFAELATAITRCLGERQITYFEFTTALAFLWFQQQKVDLVVLETGLGGRLDATNVITPLVAVITNISMDHEQYLGDTITSIATEKAGIIKPGIPVVSGVVTEPAESVIAATCRNNKSPLYQLERDFNGHASTPDCFDYSAIDGRKLKGLPLMLTGSYQPINGAIALATLELLSSRFKTEEQALRKGLQQVRWPGRMETITLRQGAKESTVLIDGAHNPAGLDALQQTLENGIRFDRLILIWGAMADKNTREALARLMPLAEKVILTQAEPERSATPDALYEQVPVDLQAKAICISTVEDSLEQAGRMAAKEDLICVAGSLYLAGKARQVLMGELVSDL